jgi:LysR family transcriptional activator of nhaA
LGDTLVEAIKSSDSENTLRLRAGITDGIPKLLAYRLLSSVFKMPLDVRLICDEGEFETLLADLALHRLDVVLTDRPRQWVATSRYSAHRLGDFATGIFGTSELGRALPPGFPQVLAGAPMLLPTRHNALRSHRSLAGKRRRAPAHRR